jgi:hypothetical protein
MRASPDWAFAAPNKPSAITNASAIEKSFRMIQFSL